MIFTLLNAFFSLKKSNRNGRRIFVIFELEILKPGREVDFWIGQPVNSEDVNSLVELTRPPDSRPSHDKDQNNDEDSIHFREFEDLDLFQP